MLSMAAVGNPRTRALTVKADGLVHHELADESVAGGETSQGNDESCTTVSLTAPIRDSMGTVLPRGTSSTGMSLSFRRRWEMVCPGDARLAELENSRLSHVEGIWWSRDVDERRGQYIRESWKRPSPPPIFISRTGLIFFL